MDKVKRWIHACIEILLVVENKPMISHRFWSARPHCQEPPEFITPACSQDHPDGMEEKQTIALTKRKHKV